MKQNINMLKNNCRPSRFFQFNTFLGRTIRDFSIYFTTLTFAVAGCFALGEVLFERPAEAGSIGKSTPSHGDHFSNLIGMQFVFIGPGSFNMGSAPSEKGHEEHEVRHKVTLTKGYWLMTTEVTQGQWKTVMGNNPSHFSECGSECPVEEVSWPMIQRFIEKLNQWGDKTIYRLPTEAEWEYAARAGSKTAFHFGNSESELKKYAWLGDNSKDKPHPVATKKANAWGLFDMHGNVFEFCSDWFGEYPTTSVTDPTGPPQGSYHTIRSGGFLFPAKECRSAFRSKVFQNLHYYGLGFRLAADY